MLNSDLSSSEFRLTASWKGASRLFLYETNILDLGLNSCNTSLLSAVDTRAAVKASAREYPGSDSDPSRQGWIFSNGGNN